MRIRGEDIPARALTLCGLTRLDTIQQCIEDVIANKVPGDLIEAGVFRGGATIFMKGLIELYGESHRRIWVADSFEGWPYNPEQYPADHDYDFTDLDMTADMPTLEEVRENFEVYGLLDDRVCFLKGWFKDTLPKAPIEQLSILRLDGDIYESTWDSLVHLYPKLSPGGYVILDDYRAFEPCRQAADDYRNKHGIRDKIIDVDDVSVYWQRS